MDIDKMIKLLQAFSDSNLSSFKYEEGNITIKLERKANGAIESKTSGGEVGTLVEANLGGETGQEVDKDEDMNIKTIQNIENIQSTQSPQDSDNLQDNGSSLNTESLSNTEENNASPEVVAKVDSGSLEIKSPTVGTFYTSSSPDGEPFVNVGDVIEKGQVICIVEAMKVMNEIESPVNGLVKDILVENEDLVEFGQVMLVLEPHN